MSGVTHEFEADSLEEKNTIFRLVNLVLEQKGKGTDDAE